MKYLISILLTLTFLTLTVKVEAKENKYNERYRIQNNLYLSSDSNNGTRSFELGDSLQTIQEADRVREERARVSQASAKASNERLFRLQSSNQGSQRAYGESAGGYGQATIVEKDTQYFNCVAYAKAKTGISASIGNGGRQGINSQEPRVGEIGVEAKRYHAVYIEKVEGDEITITEANFYRGFITMRVLHRSDFIGYIV